MDRATALGLACLLPLAAGACNTDDSPPSGGTPAFGRSSPIHVPSAATGQPLHALDLLFVIDDTPSTQRMQQALRDQLPRLLRVLSLGDRDEDGATDFPQAVSMHLAVVSSDLGLPGVAGIDRCAGLGDDAVFNARVDPSADRLVEPALGTCESDYPRFLDFNAGLDDAGGAAHDLECISAVGTVGCFFGQPLESALKSLWPPNDGTLEFTSAVVGQPTSGRGTGGGSNDGFLHGGREDESGLLVIVVLSLADDCSRPESGFLRPPGQLDPSVPDDAALLAHGLATRCTLDDQLHPIERYVDGFRALLPTRPDRVLFIAIAGVPLDAAADAPEDFGSNGEARDAFYSAILEHPDMQLAVDSLGTDSPIDDLIRASCEGELGRATPPRRLVEVARAFGNDGIVQSLCQADLTPAFDVIVERIAERLEATAPQ